MLNLKIKGGQSLKGEIQIPPSKSLSHRAIIASGLSKGGRVDNLIQSQDIIATTQCMSQLGASFVKEGHDYIVKGADFPLACSNNVFDCHESGSTLRFMIPIAMLSGEEVSFEGKGKLVTRPLDPFYDIFDKQGISYKHDGCLPLTVKGAIKPGQFEIPGDISSQFITGLLYTLPLLNGDSQIKVTSDLESKGYIDLTIDVLRAFGIEIGNDKYETFTIKGNQTYTGRDYRVEGDFSQIAFWLVAGLLNGDIKCLDMNPDSSQGDKEVLDIIQRMGGKLTMGSDFISVEKSPTKATVIDASQCPDIIPVLTVLAAVTPGTTEVINAKRLRIKECDRLNAIATELNKLGADVEELEEGLIIKGKSSLKGGRVKGWNDHRIVMSMAVASLACREDVYIEGCEAINKSYPHFFEHFKTLGGTFDEWHMEE
ncbi:3-phosphoshikimate 1-carboxyvinyltransferase [Acidaminobacter sp. JC074]|uniref:3-phosphoshikimate 1-carboxyvinyltransferase n=1 Tax=Acidaminobacter sp. JC074 TaxID=2530199 RepID=UPI001F0F9903|nr:3-phosphoshikimate 1-carboxyvinyltransferase [Acidaminobacter sp. JC074]MCH4889984.1 3-phosphoshikimate 1-carboxyvinyltransferase [Acidaminobacter sp. JC074]